MGLTKFGKIDGWDTPKHPIERGWSFGWLLDILQTIGTGFGSIFHWFKK